MIAFFGTGMLGSGFVRALLRRGEEVHVWNRTLQKARMLEADGARVFEIRWRRRAARNRVHLILSDDSAVDDVLELARPALDSSTIVIDHTTTSASGTVARAALWAKRDIPFLHAPVFMGPQNALESTGTMLASGDSARFESVRPELEAMTGKLVYLGERVDAAAAFKLLGNLFLMFLNTGFADLLGLAKALGVAPEEAATLLDHFNPGLSLPARFKRTIEARFNEPSWGLGMARKDARLMLEEAARANVTLAVLPTIAARMDQVIAEGHARSDWTVLAKDALVRRA